MISLPPVLFKVLAHSLVDQLQTRTQSPLIYSRKGIWKGNLTRAKALGKEGGKVTTGR